ncbi:hypothetical protein [Escherichia coli]|uniref:hypothetical protein n=1 Tax=Escherichia coli TaxID=562 RepID=UPI0029E7DE75|nr:hypothetical protein [Escherichia coli]MDX7977001.1 hypothetical protein [Escherichia coli]
MRLLLFVHVIPSPLLVFTSGCASPGITPGDVTENYHISPVVRGLRGMMTGTMSDKERKIALRLAEEKREQQKRKWTEMADAGQTGTWRL